MVIKRTIILLFIFSYLIFSAPFNLSWYSVETEQATIELKLNGRNATVYVPVPTEVKGYLEGFVPESFNQTLLCLSSKVPLAAVTIVKVDVQRGKEVVLPRYYTLKTRGGTVCVPVYLGYVKLESGNLLGLAKALYSALKLAAGDITGLTGRLLRPSVTCWKST